jgi:transposase-like protein|nr:transposase [Alicyclobacillus sp. SP_1]
MVRSMALVIVIGVGDTGESEVLGFDMGASEDGSFWLTFFRSLVALGLSGVRLAMGYAHRTSQGDWLCADRSNVAALPCSHNAQNP